MDWGSTTGSSPRAPHRKRAGCVRHPRGFLLQRRADAAAAAGAPPCAPRPEALYDEAAAPPADESWVYCESDEGDPLALQRWGRRAGCGGDGSSEEDGEGDAGGVPAYAGQGRPDGCGSGDVHAKHFTCVKPWLGSIRDAVPQGWTDEQLRHANTMPSRDLTLDHVYGYRTRDVRGNGFLVDSGTVLFFTASVGVVHDVGSNSQWFYRQHKEDIISMAFHKETQTVATGAIGAPFGMLCVWRINCAARTTTHLSCMTGQLQYGVLCCAFSDDGTLLTAVGDDEHHTVMVYDWKNAAPLCSLGTPGRNKLYHVAWFPALFSMNTIRHPDDGGAVLDPQNYFVTAGHKHIYIWSLAGGQLHRCKAKLTLDSERKSDSKKGDHANTSFNMVAFTLHHIVAGGSSGSIFLFRPQKPDGSGVIKCVSLKRTIGVMGTGPTRKMCLQRKTSLSYLEDCSAALQGVKQNGLVDEVAGFITTLSSPAESAENAAVSASMRKQFSECLEESEALLAEATAKATDQGTLRTPMLPYIAKVSLALDALEELKALAEDMWVDCIVQRTPNSPTSISGIQRGARAVYDRLCKAALSEAKRDTKDVPLLTPDAMQMVKHSWDSLVRSTLSTKVALIDHHRSLTGKGAETPIEKKPSKPSKKKGASTAANPAVGCISVSVASFRYVMTGGHNGCLQLFDLYPDRKGAEGFTPSAVPPGGDTVSDAACLEVTRSLWSTNLNKMDLSTISDTSPCNAVRALSIDETCTKAMVGCTSGVYIVKFTSEIIDSIRQELHGHHGDLKAHLRKDRPGPEGFGELWSLDRHPYKPQFASCTVDKTLRVWDAELRMLLKRKDFPFLAWKCCYSRTGRWIAVGFKNGCFGIYSARSLRRLWPPSSGHLLDSRYRAEKVECIRFSPDETFICVGAFNFLDLYKLSCKEESGLDLVTVDYYGTCSGVSSPVSNVDWSTDSTLLQCVNKSYELLFYDPTRKKGWRIAQVTHSRSLANVEWATHSCPLGWGVQGIFSKCMDGTGINSCARSPDCATLATGNDNYALELYNYPCVGSGFDSRGKMKYRPPKRVFYGHSSHVTCVSWCFDAAYLFSAGGNDLSVFQWKVVSREEGVDEEEDAGTGVFRESMPHSSTVPSSTRMHPAAQQRKDRGGSPVNSPAAVPKDDPPPPPVRRPHTRQWAQRHKGPVTRGTAVYVLRREANLQRRRNLERRKRAEVDVFATTYPPRQPQMPGSKGANLASTSGGRPGTAPAAADAVSCSSNTD